MAGTAEGAETGGGGGRVETVKWQDRSRKRVAASELQHLTWSNPSSYAQQFLHLKTARPSQLPTLYTKQCLKRSNSQAEVTAKTAHQAWSKELQTARLSPLPILYIRMGLMSQELHG